jgi:hypothetical protein
MNAATQASAAGAEKERGILFEFIAFFLSIFEMK